MNVIAWPWQKGGQELCPQGGRHDWEVVRSLTNWMIQNQLARELGKWHFGAIDDGKRYVDRVCLKCKKVEMNAQKALDTARADQQERWARIEAAEKIANEALAMLCEGK